MNENPSTCDDNDNDDSQDEVKKMTTRELNVDFMIAVVSYDSFMQYGDMYFNSQLVCTGWLIII